MRSELIVERLDNSEIPSWDVTAKITSCENRFEILAKPGAEIDAWKVQAILANWIQSRIDAQKSGGHNPPNSFP